MSDTVPTDVALVKVTVNMLPAAYEALVRSAEREGLSRTDALNRAVQVYDVVSALESGEFVTYSDGEVTRWMKR